MKIALTGATGFLGSALAALFLRRGYQLLALSRKDRDGQRTRRAIVDACQGLGYEPESIDWQLLEVLEVDFKALADSLSPLAIADVSVVWHAAAEMSYAGSKLEAAFAQNMTATGQLYQWFHRHAPRCERFYFVSTAYTAGFDQRQVREQLHLSPRLINVYQASKWSAEINLSLQAQLLGLPLTIFRPTIIIGDEQSGWNGFKDFGMYTLLRALVEGSRRGAPSVSLDVDGKARNNVIPVNRVIERALHLTERSSFLGPLEIFHCGAAEVLELGRCLEIAADLLAIQIRMEKPRSGLDRMIDSLMAQNKAFAKFSWDFDSSQLERALGELYTPVHLDEAMLRRILKPYFAMKMSQSLPRHRYGKQLLGMALMGARLLGISIRFEKPLLSWRGLLSSK